MAEDKNKRAELSGEELKIISLIRGLQFGELVVVVKNGAPTRAEIRQSVLLHDSGK